MARFDPTSIPTDVRKICRTLSDAGEQAWVVGGCIRDLLLGKSASDWDIATSARPDRVRRLFRKVVPTGLAHGTVTVLVGRTPYEVTTFRGEGAYSDGRRPDEVFFVGSIEEDLARRDFTVNAIAYDPVSERLVDPFGGVADLQREVIRAVGEPLERFEEDGLRVLRAARFCAALEFDLDPATEAAIRPSLSTFRQVSAERVRDEWLKTTKAVRPSRAFRVMHTTGILHEVFPELEALAGLDVPSWGFRGLEHALATVDAARLSDADPVLCVIALVSGVGRPATAQTGFEHHETVAADLAGRWFRDYRFSKDERRRAMHVLGHQRVERHSSDSEVRRWLKRATRDSVDDILSIQGAVLDGAERIGAYQLDGRSVDEARSDLKRLRSQVRIAIDGGFPLEVGDLVVSGRDVLAKLEVPPSPVIGELLEYALEAVLEDPTLNERERLLDLMREHLQEKKRREPRGRDE